MAAIDSGGWIPGVVTVDAPLMLIMEYCEHGALDEFLKLNEVGENFLKYDCRAS